MSVPVLLAMALALLVGSALQRIAGMGMGMVVAPSLTVLLGAATGVAASNVAAVLTALLILVVLRGDVDWGRFAGIAPLMVVGSVVGALVILVLDASWLDVLVGSTMLLALAWSMTVGPRVRVHGTGAALTAGAAGGFMNATAGIAGPAMTVYALATDWGQRSFAATLQPIFLLANLAALVSKAAVGAIPLDAGLPWAAWLLVAVSVPVGVLLGGVASRWVGLRAARRAAVTIAVVGAVITLGRGLGGL
ncbi:sulfite exporter TauE/SafE family protein [Ornithinimicrobium sediminis]|uniref:sulfite exporter TauE/SafE family protein n=1 Tax=Ornithinimicrobium sediminis TaxID=2904603 RepID=UPI001E4ED41E|nr:sulfite exporter TauE/SafE family protein [Ornithinimicrobium sediminis]